MRIRSAIPMDRDAAYAIAVATGDDGADATRLHRYRDLIGEIYVGPYLTFAPEHAFVLVDDDDVPLGYALGVASTRGFEEMLRVEWWPQARQRNADLAEPTPADLAILESIDAPRLAPVDIVAQYPAHGHIDLLPAAQGRGQGRALMSRLMVSLAEAGASGMHLEVGRTNTRALNFYARMGFTRLRDTADSVFVGRSLTAR
jgi:ribosomal protein S18 acetylase RimI-like enzyme